MHARPRGACRGAAGDRAPGPGAVDRRGGRRRDAVRLAKLEALLAALRGASRQDAHARRLPDRAVSGRLGVFREARGSGLPVLELLPGERALWDNRFRDRASARSDRAVVVQGARRGGLARARDSARPGSLPRLAGRTLPACWRGDDCSWDFRAWSRLGAAGQASLPRDLCQAGMLPAPRNGRSPKPLRKHAPLWVRFTWQKGCMFLCYQGLAFTLALKFGARLPGTGSRA